MDVSVGLFSSTLAPWRHTMIPTTDVANTGGGDGKGIQKQVKAFSK